MPAKENRFAPLTTGVGATRAKVRAAVRNVLPPLLAPGAIALIRQGQAAVIDPIINDPYIDNLKAVKYADVPFGSVPWGFYLAFGDPGAGKSLLMLAFVLWTNATTKTRCTYKSVSEPRSDHDSELARNLATLPTKVLGSCFTTPNGASIQPTVSVIDSVGYAMRAYSPAEGTERGKTGSMEGGMDVADQEFCRAMQKVAMASGVLIGIVGNKEVPFVDNLEGLVEGMIRIEPSSNNFDIKFRGALTSGKLARDWTSVTVPDLYIQQAANRLGYPTRK